MAELFLDGLTTNEIEAAKEALVVLYELKEEYAKAMVHMTSIQKQMARQYDIVIRVLQRIKERPAATPTTLPVTEMEEETNGM